MSTIKIKRSAVAAKVPATTDLQLGELAINTNDGKLYLKKDDGAESVVEIGGGGAKAIVQELHGTIAAANGTTTIPFDSTAPLITEGTEIGTADITLTDAAHDIHISFNMSIEGSLKNRFLILSVFRDSTCIGAYPLAVTINNHPLTFAAMLIDTPGDTNLHTYSGRVGVTGGTWSVNQPNGGSLGGNTVTGSLFLIQEFSL